jgi:hypothetical protein
MRFATLLTLFAAGAATLLSSEASAYRPFDQTDADVAEYREVEIELGPVALARSNEDIVLVAPSLIINYGIYPRLELVVEGKNEWSLRSSAERRWSPQDIAVSIKGLVRRGSLQGQEGPSIALEPGILLPGPDQTGVGTQVGAIFSVVAPAGALHLNVVPAVSRAHHAAGSIGLIAEGPREWKVRPVGEGLVYGEVGAPPLTALLCGFIAPAREALTFDGAVRAEWVTGRTTFELRGGLTWGFGP